LSHQPGKLNQVADFLSRGPESSKGGKNDNSNVVLLKPESFRYTNFFEVGQLPGFTDETFALNLNFLQKLNSLSFKDEEDILSEIRKRRQQAEASVIQGLKDDSKGTNYKETNNIITYKGMVYVPKDSSLRERIIFNHHDTAITGHPGGHKTTELIQRNYWWPNLQRQVMRYSGSKKCPNVWSSLHNPFIA
jgi:hypothetical protein